MGNCGTHNRVAKAALSSSLMQLLCRREGRDTSAVQARGTGHKCSADGAFSSGFGCFPWDTKPHRPEKGKATGRHANYHGLPRTNATNISDTKTPSRAAPVSAGRRFITVRPRARRHARQADVHATISGWA